jgi:hypothetical protein
MDAREERGLIIAATCRLNRMSDGTWLVPSQTRAGQVAAYQVNLEKKTCTCPDHVEGGNTCKHYYAASIVHKRDVLPDGTVIETKTLTLTEKKVYKQDWPKYNAAQATEKKRFRVLLHDLCRGLPARVRAGEWLGGRQFPNVGRGTETGDVLSNASLRRLADLDRTIDAHLKTMHRRTELPPLPKQTRVRGRKPHDPQFDVREALYRATGVDLTAIEGIDAIHALTLVSELGTDFTKWPTVKHFASWLGLCPNWKKTGGKVQSSRTRLGKNRAAHALRLAAWGLMRSTSYLGAFLRRQRARLGNPKAVTAPAHKLARIVYHLMRYGMGYVKQTEAAYAEEVRQRLEKQLRRRARELGFEVKKVEPPAPAEAMSLADG